jgi:hypothetical protein
MLQGYDVQSTKVKETEQISLMSGLYLTNIVEEQSFKSFAQLSDMKTTMLSSFQFGATPNDSRHIVCCSNHVSVNSQLSPVLWRYNKTFFLCILKNAKRAAACGTTSRFFLLCKLLLRPNFTQILSRLKSRIPYFWFLTTKTRCRRHMSTETVLSNQKHRNVEMLKKENNTICS